MMKVGRLAEADYRRRPCLVREGEIVWERKRVRERKGITQCWGVLEVSAGFWQATTTRDCLTSLSNGEKKKKERERLRCCGTEKDRERRESRGKEERADTSLEPDESRKVGGIIR